MTLHDLSARSVAAEAGSTAVEFHGQRMTYGELQAAVDGFASGLWKLTGQSHPRVGLLLPNCPAFIIAYLAAGRIGSVVPMNVLYRPDEARHIMADSGAAVLVTAEPFRPLVEAIRPHLPDLKHVIMVSETECQEHELSFRSLCAVPPAEMPLPTDDDVCVIIYTSGTTGQPKGAMLTHRNLVTNVMACSQVLPVGPRDRFVSALPLFHSFAATVFMLLPIFAGGSIHLIERFHPAGTLAALEQAQATVFGGVPSMFGLMLQIAVKEQPKLDNLRISISGGAALSPEVWREFEKAFNTKLIEGYGLTEASPVVAVNPPFGVHKHGSVGPPLPGVEVRIVDNGGKEVPRGEVGELLVRSGNVMKGYLGRPDDTKAVLKRGWLHTGDLVRVDEDGYLYIAGRKKELIIVGGLNVHPGEVERVLIEHPAVLEAAAFGVDDAMRGEAVWSAVTLRPEESATPKELIAFCRGKLAAFKVPRGLEIVEELPKNALGKVMRHVLRERVQSGQRLG